MARSIAAAALRGGVAEGDVATLLRAHALAMAHRERHLEAEPDSRYLHPGRTVLVLLQDADVGDVEALAAAALVESEFPELEVPAPEVEAAMGRAVAALRDAVPVPRRAGDELAEQLVLADVRVRVVALAERLDQLRHAHLWPELVRRRTAHGSAAAIYLPVAERTHKALAGRYRWWCRMFERRFLRSG
ncbi:MAG: hypothetical protein HY704_00580 [Gemmatimonadetes bacterium]|nr:hypothetical protein [Gemmatimonadota bacterium]